MANKTVDRAEFTAETTPIAPAAPLLQRDPAPTIRYRFLERVADSWAGFRDRRRVVRRNAAEPGQADQRVPEFRTDWIVGMEHACRTNQEIERRATRAAIAVLDDMIATHRGTVERARESLPDLDRQIVAAAETPIDATPMSTGEQFETPQQRQGRRHRERDSRVAGLRERRRALAEARAQAARQIVICVPARRSHWEQLLVRSSVLTEHYNRRARTYARAATRRAKHIQLSARSDLITAPEWCSPDALPPVS